MVKLRGAVPQTKVLENSFVCDDDIATALHLPKSSVFYKVKRLRIANNTPVGIETVFLPLQFCDSPDRLELDKSLYDGLKQLYGWSVFRQNVAITADMPTKDEIEFLNLSKGEAVLRTEGISLDDDNKPFLY